MFQILCGLLAAQMRLILDDEDLVLDATFQFAIKEGKQERIIV